MANISLVEITEARKSEHEGMYRCEAENPAGNVTASAWVAVKGLYNANYYNLKCLAVVLLTYVSQFRKIQFSKILKNFRSY